jgi:CDP-diacylglycerol---glycerol-3-phosphate 3-phosphatidyltransferase
VQTFENRSALASLQRRWWMFSLLCALFLLAGSTWLTRVWHPAYARGWALLTVIILAYQAWQLRINLKENHRIGETLLLAGLGWGNIITLARGVMFGGLTGFLLLPAPPGHLAWAPAALYTIGALIDFLDGYAARITNQVTRLGEKLDMSMDGWGMLVASILAVKYGQTPGWYVLVGLAMYLFNAGKWLREQLRLPVSDLPPSAARRPFAGLQMGFAFVMLWPVFKPPGTYHAAAIFALPTLLHFLVDWLVVSQTLRAGFGVRWQIAKGFAVRWAPLTLRLALLALMAQSIVDWRYHFQIQAPWLAGTGASSPLALGVLIAGLEIVIVACIAIGAAGRSMAIAGMVMLGIQQIFQPLTDSQLLLLWVYGGILYLGTGIYSIWKPEERLIARRAGEKSS